MLASGALRFWFVVASSNIEEEDFGRCFGHDTPAVAFSPVAFLGLLFASWAH